MLKFDKQLADTLIKIKNQSEKISELLESDNRDEIQNSLERLYKDRSKFIALFTTMIAQDEYQKLSDKQKDVITKSIEAIKKIESSNLKIMNENLLELRKTLKTLGQNSLALKTYSKGGS